MRLDNYLIEKSDGTLIPFSADIIRRDCADYISKDPLFPEKPLYRGLDGKFFDIMDKVISYTMMKINSFIGVGRRPKDMEMDMHNRLNSMFVKKFGWNARDGVFCSRKLLSGMYNITIFIPCGNVKYVWSPYVYDLYDTFLEMEHDYGEIDFKKLQFVIDTYKDVDISNAKTNEISFYCKSYYCVYLNKFGKYNLDYFIKQMKG